ncbi:putative nuclease HARBI1 [Cucumis melo var. makuwa]|uniref:Nuclease HARBI1 n=1 Tax=Cucumis melo var. makuwa TaxID=1194695 RepID=A0A5A7T361_CUCMM|nr:putative nuclease HARBI1 [Cucumis melo var. makuwa]
MGLIRGLRKKKKLERKLDSNGTTSDSFEKYDAIDWWDDFSKRTNELDRGSRFGFDALVFNL